MILLVEDDQRIRSEVRAYLESEGLAVTIAEDLKVARSVDRKDIQLVLLDWMLPDGEGVELLAEIRAEQPALPVIMLTARVAVDDRVTGLETGANDYVSKPFEPRELLARIRSQLRTVGALESEESGRLELGDLVIQSESREVSWCGASVPLTKVEFDLLTLLAKNPGKVFTRDELLNRVWGFDRFPTTRTVDTHISQLRQKIAESLFESVRGVGYRLKEPSS